MLLHWLLNVRTSLPTCVSGGTSYPGQTLGRLVSWDMAPGTPALLLLLLLPPLLLWFPPCAATCPAACRCYSATVECGALRLHVVPPGIPPGTQVGTKWRRRAAGGLCERPGR